MPRLPDKTALGQATPQPGRQIIGGVPPIEQQAGENLGNAVAQLGQVGLLKAQEQQQKTDALTEMKAKSVFLQQKVQLDNAFDHDPEYATFGQRYGEGITQAQKQAAALIKDPLRREAFLAETNADRAIGLVAMQKKAFAKEGDIERATLENDLTGLRESALNAPDETTRVQIIKTMQGRIQSLADRGHIDQDQAATLQKKSAQDYAEGIVNAMPIDQQITFLKRKSPLFTAGKPGGLVTAGNLDLSARPRVKNPDGSISTVRSITITDDKGQAILLPTVIGDKVVSNKEAVAHYRNTGENLGVFKDERAADNYGQALHEQQAKMYTGGGSGGGSVADLIPADKRMDMLERAQREKQAAEDHQRVLLDRQRALYREDLSFRVDDAEAAYTAGQQVEDAPTKKDFYQAFDPDQAERHWSRFKTLQNASGEIRGLYNASPVERAAILERNKPESGDGFAEKQKIHNLLQQTNDRIQAAQKADPAGYVAQTNPDIQHAYEGALSGDKTAITEYTKLTLSEQKRLGISQPEILPKQVSSAIASRFFDQTEGGQNSAKLMTELEQEWGSAFPQVYAQLSRENKLPPAALVIPNMSDDGAKERLARWSLVEDKVFEDRLPNKNTDTKDIKSTLLAEMGPLWNSLSVQNGGEQTYTTFQSQAYKLALGYTTAGKSPKEAAQQAYQEVIGHAYGFGPTYRVPKLEAPEQVMIGTQYLTNHPEKLDIAAFPSQMGLAPNQAKEATLRIIKNNPVWVTNPNETGLILYAQGNNGLNQVRTTGGKPVEMTWSQLREAASNVEGGTYQYPYKADGSSSYRYPYADRQSGTYDYPYQGDK